MQMFILLLLFSIMFHVPGPAGGDVGAAGSESVALAGPRLATPPGHGPASAEWLAIAAAAARAMMLLPLPPYDLRTYPRADIDPYLP